MSGGRVEEDCLVLCLTANNQYLCKPEFLAEHLQYGRRNAIIDKIRLQKQSWVTFTTF